MGQVWQARHGPTGSLVALKVMERGRVDEPLARAAFQAEVRAQARLDHPGIVRVHDHGVVPASAAVASLVPGSPWLAMDLAPLGSLDRYRDPMSWFGIRTLLLAVLDALAHAHARRVVHRDLKAANLLVFRRPDLAGGAPEVRISDFGVAHALRNEGNSLLPFSGTPRAMAPEQFRGELADQGPWTDLYALGCLAWELVCGEPLFAGRGADALRAAHLLREPPPLPPDVVVPVGFEAWVARCVAKSPEARYRFAADAVFDLQALVAPSGAREPRPRRVSDTAVTVPLDTGSASTLAWALEPAPPPEPLSAPPPGEMLARPSPPFPRSWRSARVNAQVRGGPGVGLGLFGLRVGPAVGRGAERDQAWAVLADVHASRQPAVILISGPPGVGKTWLAEWLAERFHEVGGGPALRGTCSRGEAVSALDRMVARDLGVGGRDGAATRARIGHVLARQGQHDAYEFEALVRLARSPAEEGGKPSFRSPEERWAVVRRAIVRAGHGRPVLAVLDEAHTSADVLGFARNLMQGRDASAAPIALVLIVEDETVQGPKGGTVEPATSSVSDHDGERRRPEVLALATLRGMAGVVEAAMSALPPAEHASLVRSLGLERDLAAQVAARTAGNPLFAVQLVSDWVRRGQIQPGPQGLVLRAGGTPALPEDLDAVWTARIRRLVRGRPSDDGEALELAALLGIEIDAQTWAAACRHAHVAMPTTLIEELVEERLWLPRPGGWQFAHALMREGLLQRIPEARLVAQHLACALAVAEVHADAAYAAERIGRHQLAAGCPDAALGPLIAGARTRAGHGEFDAATGLLRLAQRALWRIGASRDDVRFAEVSLLSGQVLRARGRAPEARRAARRAAGIARAQGAVGILAAAIRLEAGVARFQGELLLARDLLQEAQSLSEKAGVGQAETRLDLARVALRQGSFEEAKALAVGALEMAREAGQGDVEASALRTMAQVAASCDDVDGAVALAQEALRVSRELADRVGEASALLALGRAAEVGDEPDVAHRLYGQAAELYDTIGSPDGHVARLAAGRALVSSGDWDQAREVVDACGEAFAALGRRAGLGSVDVVRLSIDAHAQDWIAWRRHLRRASRLLAATSFVDPDLALGLERAAAEADCVGAPERAAEARKLAARLWRKLGDEARALRCLPEGDRST
jgi:eukaryotic-like serine/threonine-protein kinase